MSLGGLLQSHNGGGLEPQVLPNVLGDLSDEALEGQLPDQELGRPLVPADLSQGTGLGAEPVTPRPLDSRAIRGLQTQLEKLEAEIWR